MALYSTRVCCSGLQSNYVQPRLPRRAKIKFLGPTAFQFRQKQNPNQASVQTPAYVCPMVTQSLEAFWAPGQLPTGLGKAPTQTLMSAQTQGQLRRWALPCSAAHRTGPRHLLSHWVLGSMMYPVNVFSGSKTEQTTGVRILLMQHLSSSTLTLVSY